MEISEELGEHTAVGHGGGVKRSRFAAKDFPASSAQRERAPVTGSAGEGWAVGEPAGGSWPGGKDGSVGGVQVWEAAQTWFPPLLSSCTTTGHAMALNQFCLCFKKSGLPSGFK